MQCSTLDRIMRISVGHSVYTTRPVFGAKSVTIKFHATARSVIAKHRPGGVKRSGPASSKTKKQTKKKKSRGMLRRSHEFSFAYEKRLLKLRAQTRRSQPMIACLSK